MSFGFMQVMRQLTLFFCMFAAVATGHATIPFDVVNVGNPGNAPDQTGFGSVAYNYAIGTYEVTNTQYAAFLNAVAVTDPFSLYPSSYYGTTTHTDDPTSTRGIVQSGVSGGYSYSVAADMANKPADYISWFSAARFSNWLANGQPTGLEGATTTENGAYTLNGAMTGGFTITRNLINPNTSAATTFWIPSENEWYKAAYYDPTLNSGTGGYWKYATRSNTTPTLATADLNGNINNPGLNVANYNKNCNWNGAVFEKYINGQWVASTAPGGINEGGLTSVGSAGPLSTSFYGTYDQAGNVWEWSEGIEKNGTARGLRQGSANDPILSGSNSNDYIGSDFSDNGIAPDDYRWNAGFRVAMIPEPSSLCMVLMAALALGFGRRVRENG